MLPPVVFAQSDDVTVLSHPIAAYPAAYGLVGQPFPQQPTLVTQQHQQPQQQQQREGETHPLSHDLIKGTYPAKHTFSSFSPCYRSLETNRAGVVCSSIHVCVCERSYSVCVLLKTHLPPAEVRRWCTFYFKSLD